MHIVLLPTKRLIIRDPKNTRNNIVPFEEDAKCVPTRWHVKKKTKLELLTEVGDAGYILFHDYVTRQGKRRTLFADTSSARALGWSVRKVKEVRRKLVKTGWFIQYNEYYDKTTDEYVIRTILGKDNIIRYLKLEHGKGNKKLDKMFG
jgi:hypothetical protein